MTIPGAVGVKNGYNEPRMAMAKRNAWRGSAFFHWTIRLGTFRGTVVVMAICIAVSLGISLLVTAAFHRVTAMGTLISIAIPALLVPATWSPFLRVYVQLDATEAELRRSEEKYRSILERMNDAYVEVDRQGGLSFFNDALCRITGYGREALAGRAIRDFLPPRRLRKMTQVAGRLLKGKQTGEIYEFPITAPGRAPRFVDISLSLVRDQAGRWCGYRALIRDVTDRVRAERERQEIENQLQRARKMEALGILAGGVAHDLNNVLSGIIGYPDLLLLEVKEDGELRDSLLEIKHSGERAATIVQDLLTLSRRGVLVRQVMNLNEIVSGYLGSPEHAQLQKLYPEIRVTTALDPQLYPIEGSPVHLAKTVMNLVWNSFEAILPPGTVSLTTGNRYLDRPLQGYDRVRPGEYVTLTVADTGVGIAPEDLERIFEPFYTKKVMGRSGTGLGMAVVWGTVKDHEGYIDVRSEVGRGSAVTLFFPAGRSGPPVPPDFRESADLGGHGERILVVDDLPEQRRLATKMLKRLGYRVQAVASGEEALSCLATAPVDMVLLDMILGAGPDGLETFRRLRTLRPDLRAVITSGFTETERVQEALRLGAGAYVKKPFSLETIAQAIRAELRR